MSPKPKDDREEPEDTASEDGAADEAAAVDADAKKTAAAAYGRRPITRSGKFPKMPSSSSGKSQSSSSGKSQSSPAIRVREEGELMGSSGTSRYTLVAPRIGKKKKTDPPAE